MKIIILILTMLLTANTTTPTKTAISETETVYLICDVVDTKGEDIYCLMPNGDIEIFMATDLPEEMELVILKATDLEDYSTYEVVAIR